MLPYGLASVRLPPEVTRALTGMFGLQDGQRLPIVVECDDLHLLKRVALSTDTVLAAVTDVVVHEVASGAMQAVEVEGVPQQAFATGRGVAERPQRFRPRPSSRWTSSPQVNPLPKGGSAGPGQRLKRVQRGNP